MLNKLRRIFGSMTKAQEILYLLKDAKDVVRQGFYDEELPMVGKFCNDNNLFLVKSRFKVLLADETAYSNKGIRIPSDDKRSGMSFVYISKVEEKSWLASYYEMMNNQQDLGLILGYPKCCVDYFCNHFSAENPNPEITTTNPWTNISKREKDLVLLSHFPCAADCLESVKLAKRYYETLVQENHNRAQELLLALE